MNATLPFGLPAPTALYLTLYLATLVVHFVFMHYVLAGTAILAAISCLPAPLGQSGPWATIRRVLGDWMPFALSAAITAGVAPLLFVQIVYQQSFYSAQLLLQWRWIGLVPVLILGFYLLYVYKSRFLQARRGLIKRLVAGGALACFIITAFTWTENHLLARHPDVWPSFYEARRLAYGPAELWPRIGFWLALAFPTTAVLLGWQTRRRSGTLDGTSPEGAAPEGSAPDGSRPLVMIAMCGLLITLIWAGLCWRVLDSSARTAITGPLARFYLWLAAIGVILQILGAVPQWRSTRWHPLLWTLLSAGVLAMLCGVAGMREAIRLAHVDLAQLAAAHADAAGRGGMTVFLIFAALNAALCAWCIVMTRGNNTEGGGPQRTGDHHLKMADGADS